MEKKAVIWTTILVTIILFLCCIVINRFIDSKKLKTESEIIEIFKENKESFINVSNELIEFQCHWSIRKKAYEENFRSDWKGIILKNGVQLIVHEQENFDEILLIQNKAENNRSIEDIINKLEFPIITNNCVVDTDSVYFIKQTAIGFSSGIIYCPNEKPRNPYIAKLIQLEPSWFYFEEK